MTSEASDSSVALAVDLDGTLCRTDTLHEALLALAAANPLRLLQMPGWLAEGRAGLKARVADFGVPDPEKLPFNEAVVEMVRTAREAGRRTVLVSAADHRQVTAVAEATGLFDEAYGSAEGRNLKGQAKADFLVERFKDFDYVGDSLADLPVWAAARRAITVQAGPGLRHAAADANAEVSHISPPDGHASAMFKALRPHQWSKNLLLLVPALAAHDAGAMLTVLLAVIAFSMTASAIYVINDLLDLPNDRAHPRKRNRPFAAGLLPARTGLVMSCGLLIGALALSILIGKPAFFGILTLYLITTFLYSLWLKQRLIVDVLTLSGLYTLRVMAGGAAAGVVLSPWLLGFSMFLFLALAAIKRQAELDDQMRSGRESAGRAYEVEDLPILRSLATSTGTAAVLVLALYVSSDDVRQLYSRPEFLWLICPLLLYWITRMVMKAHRGLMSDDPIVFAVTDRVSILIVLAAALAALAAV